MDELDQYLFHDDWYAQIPNVHRWLNGDESQPFALVYPHGKFNVDFWFAPYYVMRAILGWRDLAAGCANLDGAHGDLDGPADMMWRAWGRDVLGSLAWWAWSNPHQVADAPPCAAFLEAGLAEEFEPIAQQHGFGGGYDPKHLLSHVQTCTRWYQDGGTGYASEEPIPEDMVVIKTENPRRVALIVERFEDWPPELGRLSGQLRGGTPSWHVHVVSRTTGYIGRFRRCHDCGRWFQGRASHHKWGHAEDE